MNRFIEQHERELLNEYRESVALSEIVTYMDSSESFAFISNKVLDIIGRYLDVSHVGLMVVEDDKRFEVFSEWVKDEKIEFFERAVEDVWDDKIVCGEDIYVMSSNECIGKREFLYIKYGISALLARPLVVYGKPQMVLMVADDSADRVWTVDQIQFISNVVRMLEGIIMRKLSSESLASSKEAMRQILDNIGSGVVVVNKDTRDIVFCNSRMASIYKGELVGKKCSDIGICGTSKNCKNCKRLDGITKYWEEYDLKLQRWFEKRTSEIAWVDGSKAIVFNITDISKKKKYEKRIEFQANNDFLTGLYNRMRCEADLYNIVKKASMEESNGYLLFIDLDNFKHINDGLGHQYGDMLLKLISMGLQHINGISDSCYRVGGDEFVIIVKPEMKDKVNEVIVDVMDMFNKPWLINGTEYYTTMSMGVVAYPEDGTDVNELIKKADIAMYDAKNAGKNTVVYYNADNAGEPVKRLDVEKNMRTAIAVGGMEFELYIQPIMDALTGNCIGGESLIRWNSHELGFLMPMDFIPLAEHLGLIVIIGEYFLRKACRINRKWSERGIEKKLHVNLSVVQLVQNNIVDTITSIIKETGVNPENIILEITESLAINDMTNMKKVIDEIKKLGVGIALDDFGTGYSSLSYIKQMNFDIIKVDKNFIEDITSDDYAKTFIKLITELSEKLGAKVCVEGVEDSEQLEVLRNMNVNMIQGYYYGKPMPYREFEKQYLDITD